jgi:hypothetical protein
MSQPYRCLEERLQVGTVHFNYCGTTGSCGILLLIRTAVMTLAGGTGGYFNRMSRHPAKMCHLCDPDRG